MLRIPLSPLVVASAAILLVTSVTPSGRVAVPMAAATGTASASRASPTPTVAATPPVGSGAAGSGRSIGSARPGAAGGAGGTVSAGGAGGAGTDLVRGAVQPAASAAADRARWRWPVRPRPPVARPFRAPVTTYGAGHRGLDLAVADDTPVLAVEDGVVTHAGLVAGRGTVTVAHRGGLSSTYEPVDAMVAVGAVVVTGQVIGVLRARAGPAHCGPRTCLHLGARRGTTYLDPYPLLAGGRVALLPLDR